MNPTVMYGGVSTRGRILKRTRRFASEFGYTEPGLKKRVLDDFESLSDSDEDSDVLRVQDYPESDSDFAPGHESVGAFESTSTAGSIMEDSDEAESLQEQRKTFERYDALLKVRLKNAVKETYPGSDCEEDPEDETTEDEREQLCELEEEERKAGAGFLVSDGDEDPEEETEEEADDEHRQAQQDESDEERRRELEEESENDSDPPESSDDESY